MRPINLLPPEVAAKSKTRRRAAGVVLGVVAFAAVLALATIWLQGQAREAEDALEQQLAANDRIRAEIAQLAPAQQLRDDYEEGSGRIATVLATDVAWGRLLNDLARIINDRAWITTLTAQSTNPSEEDPAFGSMTVNGVAFWFPDASTWLRILDSDLWPAVGAGWVNSTSGTTIGEIPVVNFTSAASLTGAALSNRVVDLIPEVPE